MSAVIAAIFPDHEQAVQVRTQLVSDGFPTDRVRLTSRRELGQAQVVSEESIEAKLVEYFLQLFPQEPDQGVTAHELAGAVIVGRAVVAVHPRGETETVSALELLKKSWPSVLRSHDLDKQFMEHAAAGSP